MYNYNIPNLLTTIMLFVFGNNHNNIYKYLYVYYYNTVSV